jgi:hypothetical protein
MGKKSFSLQSNPQVATFLRATVLAIFSLSVLVAGLSATLQAAPQQPTKDLPVSLDRIREGLETTPTTRLKLDMPLQVPVARFKTRVDQRVYVLTLEEWIEKEFKLTALQRQSANWAGMCCGGYRLASGSYGVRLVPLFKSVQKALQRRRARKIREQIARDLAQVEAARK